jgi:hypothetical protein
MNSTCTVRACANYWRVNVKGEVHTITYNEGTRGGVKNSRTLSMTSTLDGGGYLKWDVLNIQVSAFIKGRKKGQIMRRCNITAHNSNTCVATCNSQQQLHSTFPQTHTHTHTQLILTPSTRYVHATGRRKSLAKHADF